MDECNKLPGNMFKQCMGKLQFEESAINFYLTMKRINN